MERRRIMMELINLANTSEEKGKFDSPVDVTSLEADSKPEYPYGLRFSLDHDTLDKIPGMDQYDVEDTFDMTVTVTVVSKSADKTDKGAKKRMELQITDAAIDGSPSKESDFSGGFDLEEDEPLMKAKGAKAGGRKKAQPFFDKGE
jgi:hypothetical protein